MSKIEIGKWSNLLRRMLAMSGVVDVAGELAPEISPTFVLESERPEWEFLKGAKLMSSQISVTKVVGQQSTGRLRNPVGSQILAVITKINWAILTGAANTAGVVLINRVQTIADLANIVASVCRDTRYPALNTSGLIVSQDNVGSAGDFFYNATSLDNTTHLMDLPFVLTPGFAIDVNAETAEVELRANIHWIERRLGELEVAT